LAAYSTYALEAEIESTGISGIRTIHSMIDTRDCGSSVIIGGEDHKTGQEEETESLR
jgi:hypothetical protein